MTKLALVGPPLKPRQRDDLHAQEHVLAQVIVLVQRARTANVGLPALGRLVRKTYREWPP